MTNSAVDLVTQDGRGWLAPRSMGGGGGYGRPLFSKVLKFFQKMKFMGMKI